MRALMVLFALAGAAHAETLLVTPREVTEWKSVFATVEARRMVPARARIGGTVAGIGVSEGDRITAGSEIGRVEDQKLDFQLAALDAQIAAAQAQLQNAEAELGRGEELVERGVATAQRLDALRTQVDVAKGQIAALSAQRDAVTETQGEGAVLAPDSGLVVSVPVSAGEVVMPGEPVAMIGAGGFFLRLAIPERYAEGLREGAGIELGDGGSGRLARVYPLIAGGRVQADIEVEGLTGRFVGARVPVRIPVGSRLALLVPEAAVTSRAGLDFVVVGTAAGPVDRVVVPGGAVEIDGTRWVEIVGGLYAGETVALP